MNPPFSRSFGLGADALTGARHLKPALGRLRRGGRLVAFMPDWFRPSAKLREIYATVLAGSSVRRCIAPRGCFAKHGTGIDVRLYVIDKQEGLSEASTICRSSVSEALAAVALCDRPELLSETPTLAGDPRSGGGLLRAVRTAAAPVARKFRAATRNEALLVA